MRCCRTRTSRSGLPRQVWKAFRRAWVRRPNRGCRMAPVNSYEIVII
jgi:hypothetical protein